MCERERQRETERDRETGRNRASDRQTGAKRLMQHFMQTVRDSVEQFVSLFVWFLNVLINY